MPGETTRPLYAHRLLADLQAARADSDSNRRSAKPCTVDLLMLNDFGTREPTAHEPEGLPDVIRVRHERKLRVLTSDRIFEEWPDPFDNALLASAALGRRTLHCHSRGIAGRSYRQRGRAKEVEPKARP